MIYGLRGKVHQLDISKLYLDTGAVVYEIWIPFKIFDELKDRKKEEIFIYIYHSINERGQKLFGFANRKERDLFELLKSLQGIGEMTALRVLSFLEAGELLQIVKSGEKSKLEKIPKIKGKTSEKILFEVKQNVKKFESFLGEIENPVGANNKDKEAELAVLALVQLGFDEKTASKQVDAMTQKGISETADIVREVLKTAK